jgi:hypothetical protein
VPLQRGGTVLSALLSHGAGQRHLWSEALFQAQPSANSGFFKAS